MEKEMQQIKLIIEKHIAVQEQISRHTSDNIKTIKDQFIKLNGSVAEAKKDIAHLESENEKRMMDINSLYGRVTEFGQDRKALRKMWLERLMWFGGLIVLAVLTASGVLTL